MSFTESAIHLDGKVSVLIVCDRCEEAHVESRRYVWPAESYGRIKWPFATAQTSEIIARADAVRWFEEHQCRGYAERTDEIIQDAVESNDVEALAGMLRAIVGKHKLVERPISGDLECTACLFLDAYAAHGHDYSITRREIARYCTAHGTIHEYHTEGQFDG